MDEEKHREEGGRLLIVQRRKAARSDGCRNIVPTLSFCATDVTFNLRVSTIATVPGHRTYDNQRTVQYDCTVFSGIYSVDST